ncbi:MAG: integrase arm-type DNA-binding domain-containing protein [Pseudomonadota bacterium]|nr:integrase arm-type DNA-binding domain-containing protein [Pseudomonadota bacterium]
MLTDVQCKNAAPRDKAYKLADGAGLYLFILPSGTKSWRWKYRVPKGDKTWTEKRLVFGKYPEMGPKKAREAREAAAKILREGSDPAVSKQQQRAAFQAKAGSSFKVVALDWFESKKPGWSTRYADIILKSLTQDVFPRIGHLPVTEITTPLVLQVLRPIEKRGAVETAHRVRQRISEVYARAIGAGIAEHDPAAIASRALSAPRKGKFPAVRTVAAAREVLLKTEAKLGSPLGKLSSRLLALTGVRLGVVRIAEAGEFEGLDGAEALWRIPAAKMKLSLDRKRDEAFEHVVPLSRQAVEIVKVAMRYSGRAKLLFRSNMHGDMPMSDNTMSKAYREAGFQDRHVPHGWRSTFSTIMNERAEQLQRPGDRAIIDLMLAHVPNGVEAAYNRAAYMPRRREIAQEWADLLMTDLAPPETLLQVPLRA